MPRRVATFAVCAVAAAGCRQLFGIDDTGAVAIDASDVEDEDAAGGADAPTALWGDPVPIELGSPPGVNDDDPSLTADLLELYFNSDRAGDWDLYVVRRSTITEPWGLPQLVTELSSIANDTTPEVSLDGLTMFFASNRSSPTNDLYVAFRPARSDPWSVPTRLAQLSSDVDELAGCPSMDGAQILLSRNLGSGNYDIFLAGIQSGAIEPIAELNTPAVEIAGCMSPDQRFLYYEAGTASQPDDLFVAERGALGGYVPRPIDELNTAEMENDAWVSPDGRHLFFHSDRGGRDRIYESTR